MKSKNYHLKIETSEDDPYTLKITGSIPPGAAVNERTYSQGTLTDEEGIAFKEILCEVVEELKTKNINKMTDCKIHYSCNQKDWFRNMTGIVIDYRHKGEANHMYLVHMLTPKMSIDRVGFYPKNWRWR